MRLAGEAAGAAHLPTNMLVALAAAVAWGGGDFSGGMGVKAAGNSTAGALRVVLWAHSVSLIVLALFVVFLRQPISWSPALGWALAAGVAGGLSLTAFYMALSRGAMGVSAALSGLVAAAIPAAISAAIEGAPSRLKTAGFAVAGLAIWVIAAAPVAADKPGSRSTTALALAGGFGFGIYFVALRFANPLGVFVPMALARVGSLITCSILILCLHSAASSGAALSREARQWALGVALLDTGGNLLFLWATRLGRLDVAAVLASLYPASTILLAAWRLGERPTHRQWAGMAAALAAVVLITI